MKTLWSVLLVLVGLGAQGADLPIVQTLSALRGRTAYTTNDLVIVKGALSAGDWGAERIARYVPNASATATNIGCEFASSLNSSNHWRFEDCSGPVLDVRWFQAFGAQIDPENLLNEQDSAFSDLTRDSAWTGYGDGNRILTDPAGTDVTYGVLAFPASPSAYGTYANMEGYSREPGISIVPPGGTLSMRLTRRGHGYTNTTESVTVVQSDGTNAPAAFSIQIGQGLRDAFFASGGLKIVTHPSSRADQYMKLSYYATTNSPLGGLKAPLVSGKTYYYSLTASLVSGVSRTLYIGTSDSAKSTFTPTGFAATYTGTFTADGTELRIGLNGSSSAGEVFLLDDIVVTLGTAVSDPSDEGANIEAAFAATGAGTLKLPPGRKFVSNRGFILRNGQKLDGSDSMLKIDVGTSRADGIQIFGEGSELRNVQITYTASTPTDNEGEGSQSIVGVGHFQYTDYPQAGNVKLTGLKLYGGGKITQGPNALLIGGAYNITADNIYIHGHTNLFNAVGVYWSGYNVQSVGTVHPRNILLQNINIGAMQGGGSSGANAITISGATGVQVRNLEALSTSGNFIRVTPGDIGFQRAKAQYGSLVQAGVSFDDVRCASVGRYGVRLQNITPYDATESNPFIATNVPVTFDLHANSVVWPGTTNRAPDGALVKFTGTVPTGLSANTNYWVTWSKPSGFKLRAADEGSGNGQVIELTGSYTNVYASVWNAHLSTIGPLEVRGLQIIGVSDTYDGILADGCDGLLVHGLSLVTGFRHGAWIESYTPNKNITLQDVEFFDNHRNGVNIPVGYNIVVQNCKIYGNGVSGTGDTAAGIWLAGGSAPKLLNNQLGRQFNESTQGVGIKVDNSVPELEWTVMEDNKVFGAVAAQAYQLNTTAPTNLWTFSRVMGNTFVPSATLTNSWQSGASLYPFPVLTASSLDAQKFTIAYDYAASFWVQRIEIGANANVTGQPGDFNRTVNTEKNGILQVPSYYTGIGTNAQPVQMFRMMDFGTSSRLYLGAGESGGSNRGATYVDIRTVASTAEGAAQTVGLEMSPSGTLAIGSGASGAQDSAASTTFVGGKAIKLPLISTNGIILKSGLLMYDTNRSRIYWSDGTDLHPTFTVTEYNDLTDSGDTSLHYHSTDRDRANHTGTQSYTTITGLGALALLNDAPTNGLSYSRKDGAWVTNSTASGGTSVFVEGTSVSNPNFTGSGRVSLTVSGATNVTPDIVANSLTTNHIDTTFRSFITGQPGTTYSAGNGLQLSSTTFSHKIEAGTNIVLTTNGTALVINSSSSASGGSTYTTNRLIVPLFVASTNKIVLRAETNEVSIVPAMTTWSSTNIAANTLEVGSVIHVKASGKLDASSASNWTGGTFKLTIGGLVITTAFDETESTLPSAAPWTFDAYVTVQSLGAAASNSVAGALSYSYAVPVSNSGANMRVLSKSGTLDTTASNNISLTFQNTEPTQEIDLYVDYLAGFWIGKEVVAGGGGTSTNTTSTPFIYGDTNIQYITNTTAATSVFSVTNAASALTNDGEALMFFIRGSVLQNSGGSANHSLTITHGGHVMMSGAGITTFATSSSRRPLLIDGEIYRMSATKALMRLRYVIGSNKSGGGYYGDEGAGPTVTREFVSNDNSSLTNATYTLDWSVATNVFKIQLANSVNNMQTEVYVRTLKR